MTGASLAEEDLPRYAFQPDEGVLLCDHAHAEFLGRHVNMSIHEAKIVALTAAAHGTALRVGLLGVVPPYELAGYPDFIGQDYERFAALSKSWLGEMSLAVTIEGINLGEFDALYQYWFFEYAAYIAGIAERVFAALPDLTRFFVPVGESFLPAELFLDTDVAAAVVRHVGESLGRSVVPIVMRTRPLHFTSWTNRRPFMDAVPAVARMSGAPDEPSRYRIGVVPAVMHRYDRLAAALGKIPSTITLFSSAWARDGAATSEGIEVPSPEWQVQVEQTLDAYWQAFRERRNQSTLPDYIVRNPYLDDQFFYILRHRWFTYAKYIYMAAHFVSRNPLDLFIHCDHFTGEGTILSHLYRRQGTKIAVAQHSPHFNDTPYAPWKITDAALVTTGFAEILARRCGFTEIYHVGYSAYGEPKTAAPEREKPVVLFLANATEVQFPLLDVRAMLEALSILAVPPPHLAGKVEVAVRLKPGIFAEDPLIFEKLCGLPEQTTRERMAMSLKQCLESADCVVGIGLSTSGYLEVIDRGKPLVHVATAEAHPMCRHDFIPDTIGRVTDNSRLWKEVEAVLFDADHRENLLAVQRDYIERDRKANVTGDGDPLVAALTMILEAAAP